MAALLEFTTPSKTEEMTSPHDVRSASSVQEIRAALANLNRREAAVTARLDALIASQNELSRDLGRLDLLRAQMGTQVLNARAISKGMLSDAATTAGRISSAVKRLDLEQENVKATLTVVEQVAELKACVSGVVGSMGAPQDWETAAGYLDRASRIPDEVIDGTFAEEIVPNAEIPDPPRVTLENAAESLCGLFLREFERAIKENDGSRVTRFFKLFPLINRSEVGLDAYGRYVCQGVSARARSNLNAGTGGAQTKEGFFYANALSALFEHIAQIVDAHQPLVERHYGKGSMTRVVERLHAEANIQGGIVLDSWGEERRIARRLTEIKTYAFSFLVSSFIPAQKAMGQSRRSESPLTRAGTPDNRDAEDDGIDMKETDSLLGEAAVMLGRWTLYTRFLATKTSSAPSAMNGDSEAEESTSEPLLIMPTFLAKSTLQRKIQNILLEPFNNLTTFFFRRSVERAFQIDEQPSDLTLNPQRPLKANPPFINSAVDDVMYILNQVLQRTLSTQQRDVVANVVPTLGRILSADFIGMIQRKMRDESFPKSAVQGGVPPDEKVISFLVLINSLDISIEYLQRIISNQLGTPTTSTSDAEGRRLITSKPEVTEMISNAFPFGDDAEFVMTTLRKMETAFKSKATELAGDGINVLFHQVIKPKLRPMLSDAFRDVDYNIKTSKSGAVSNGDEDDSENSEEEAEGRRGSNNPRNGTALVTSRFAHAWTSQTAPLKRLLTLTTYSKLLQTTTLPYIASTLEKRLWSLHGRVSPLGAVRLERDVAGIVAAACGEGRYSLREIFARCVEIVTVAGMESEEWEEEEEEFIRAGGQEEGRRWVLDEKERVRARGLVVGQ